MISQILMRNENAACNRTVFGFTLVELLLVLVLIAISMAAITPKLGSNVPSWQVRESSKNMLATIRLAQRLALTRQEIMVFVVNTNNGSFAVRSVNHSADSDGKSNDFSLPKQFLGKGVKIAQLEGFKQIGSEKGLAFWPDGRTKTAHITLTTKKDSEVAEWHIFIDNNGSAVLQEVVKNE